MKRKPAVRLSKTKRPYVKLTQLEERFALLLLLLQHNFEKVIRRTKTRRR